LKNSSVLVSAMGDGVALTSWDQDTFAYAESYDEAGKRYRGLRGGEQVLMIEPDSSGLIVKSEIAAEQLKADRIEKEKASGLSDVKGEEQQSSVNKKEELFPKAIQVLPKRLYGTVLFDPNRVGRDAGKVAEEVIAHLEGIV